MANIQNPNIPINLNVVTFDSTPENRFYMCISCGSSLLSFENLLAWSRDSQLIYCQQPVNVRIGGERVLNDTTLQDVYCIQCDSQLGLRVHNTNRREPSSIIREGNYMFYMDSVQFWDGHQAVYAQTLQPVGGN